ncbi:conserved hypothetical protein [Vibrio cholerae O1 str. 2010EL-1786]|uniref:Uncharacterized protein n=2 Tax=Vibrio cholerae TaxID=666 RepID=Q9KNA3_VIBCH|nr:hypothetical protein VC_A0062 [Vibrio cholerae O1 biovar El Tor str. N16961]ACP07042.1 conserved hypothetical protein [Vibrio cholerae M66-2]AET29275.1 conserved hypothetical protein [Vibrio cholerae O1 str. 2010EL-1786]
MIYTTKPHLLGIKKPPFTDGFLIENQQLHAKLYSMA